MKQTIFLLTLLALVSAPQPQPIQDNYLMTFHACDTASVGDCHDPRNHIVYLAQSADGINWELVPGWEPYGGSVPDVIRRGETLYIYTPGQLMRYYLNSGTMDGPHQVRVNGLQAGFVDPSLILDKNGNLVLFFLYGQQGMDPAGCAEGESSCLRAIGSATEVPGSDGEEFILDEGQRAAMTIDPSSHIKTFSDPDIFFDGGQYVLYVSYGASTSVWVSKELRGEFFLEQALPQGLLTNGTGGVPSGHFDPGSSQYWTYTHIDLNGKSVIRGARHTNLTQPLNESDFTPIISGESIGLGANVSVASPGFTLNTASIEAADIPLEGAPASQPSHTPEFNPFENLTPEMEACLKDTWGEEVFNEITTFQRPPSFEEEPALQECLGDEFRPPGEGPGGPEGEHNPFSDQVYYAISSDGLNWSEGTLLAEKASVPDVLRTSDGTLWAFWVDFSFMTGPNMEQIGIARSDDGGQSWQRLENAIFTGLGEIVPVDPEVIELPDGRIRMYFYDIAVRQIEHPIYSAISEDGIHFELEEGVRLLMDDIYDPDVILLPDGGYRMYVNAMDILSASSRDGLEFTPDEGVRVEQGAVPGSIVLPDGTIRMYNCVQGISVFESQDGLDFELLKEGLIRPEVGQRQILCDPSVAALDDGYLLVYKLNPGQ